MLPMRTIILHIILPIILASSYSCLRPLLWSTCLGTLRSSLTKVKPPGKYFFLAPAALHGGIAPGEAVKYAVKRQGKGERLRMAPNKPSV